MGRKEKNLFLQNRALYEEAVRRHVCEHCEDMGADGVCQTKDPEGCGVFRNLPELVRIARELHELRIEPYAKAVREHVCVYCKNSSAAGKECEIRSKLDCGLDRYLPLVIDAIEEVDKILARKARNKLS